MKNFEQFGSIDARPLVFKNERLLLPALVMRSGPKALGTLGSQLYLGYMNQAALDETRVTGEVTMYSMTRDRLYKVGDGNGGGLITDDILTDYERTLLLMSATSSRETNQ